MDVLKLDSSPTSFSGIAGGGFHLFRHAVVIHAAAGAVLCFGCCAVQQVCWDALLRAGPCVGRAMMRAACS